MKLILYVFKFGCVQGAHGPLTVKWADVELGAKKRKAMEESQDPNRENCQVGLLKPFSLFAHAIFTKLILLRD